jgi:hypothetical protein
VAIPYCNGVRERIVQASTSTEEPRLQKLLLKSHERFYSAGRNIAQNLRTLLLHAHRKDERPECLIADLAERIGFGLLKEHLQDGLRDFRGCIYVIIDRLDQGYEPDTIGIAMVAGILEGTHALQTALPILRPLSSFVTTYSEPSLQLTTTIRAILRAYLSGYIGPSIHY